MGRSVYLLGLMFLFISVKWFVFPSLMGKPLGSRSPILKEFLVKKITITAEDVDYFVSTVVDYLGDDEEFGQVVDSLNPEEAQRLYEKVEEDLDKQLTSHKGKFSSREDKDEWILGEVEKIRLRVIKNVRDYLKKGA